MLDRRAFLALFIVAATFGSATAGVSRESSSGTAEKGSHVSAHVPQIDGPVTSEAAPDGRIWAAWAYRASGEFDIAVSSRDASTSAWGTPLFLGRRDGVDQTDPTLAVDPRGNVYVAFTITNPSRVAVAVLPAGTSIWSRPIVVSGTETASSPALIIVGERLIVGYRTVRGVGMVDLPVFGDGFAIDGISDGPDGYDPLGVHDKSQKTDAIWIPGP